MTSTDPKYRSLEVFEVLAFGVSHRGKTRSALLRVETISGKLYELEFYAPMEAIAALVAAQKEITRERVSQPLQSDDAALPSATPRRSAKASQKAPAGVGSQSVKYAASTSERQPLPSCLPSKDATHTSTSQGRDAGRGPRVSGVAPGSPIP